VGHTAHHVIRFINIIKSLRVGPEDIFVSFDVVSLFTMVSIREALHLLSQHCDDDIMRIFRLVLTSSFFRCNGEFYQQIDGTVTGSPLSLVIANFFMEHFEETALGGRNTSPSAGFVTWMTHSPSGLMVQASLRNSFTIY
jgi:hypothetical protein